MIRREPKLRAVILCDDLEGARIIHKKFSRSKILSRCTVVTTIREAEILVEPGTEQLFIINAKPGNFGFAIGGGVRLKNLSPESTVAWFEDGAYIRDGVDIAIQKVGDLTSESDFIASVVEAHLEGAPFQTPALA